MQVPGIPRGRVLLQIVRFVVVVLLGEGRQVCHAVVVVVDRDKVLLVVAVAGEQDAVVVATPAVTAVVPRSSSFRLSFRLSF